MGSQALIKYVCETAIMPGSSLVLNFSSAVRVRHGKAKAADSAGFACILAGGQIHLMHKPGAVHSILKVQTIRDLVIGHCSQRSRSMPKPGTQVLSVSMFQLKSMGFPSLSCRAPFRVTFRVSTRDVAGSGHGGIQLGKQP